MGIINAVKLPQTAVTTRGLGLLAGLQICYIYTSSID